MAFSPSDSPLFEHLFGDTELSELFSDQHYIRDMLDVEATLARVQGRLGIIPADAARHIETVVSTFSIDIDSLKEGFEKNGVPVKDLVRQLRKQVGSDYSRYVHLGATTQDIMDTALILRLRTVTNLLETNLLQLVENFAGLAERHRNTIMAGRTHSQQALPITFGLKVAVWLAPLLRHVERLRELRKRLLIVQFGGAAGTLASSGKRGMDVCEALAKELGLRVAPVPWHVQRDNLVEFAGWLSLVSGSLAKMAQDVILLAQSEVGEVRESTDPSRGGSSTMPQKRNPVASEVIVAAARTNTALLSAMHGSLIAEHERATHGLQVEWMTLPQMIAYSNTAIKKALFLSENLVVDAEKMRKNMEASNGLMLAEALKIALVEHMDEVCAGTILRRAIEKASKAQGHLIDMAKDMTEAPIDWKKLRKESKYLGSTEVFIDNVLVEAKKCLSPINTQSS